MNNVETAPASATRRAPTPGHLPPLPWVNLPAWRWGTITKIPLVAVSRPLHSGVCETRQDAGLPVIHSAISDSGRLRTRGGQPNTLNFKSAMAIVVSRKLHYTAFS